MKAHKGMRPHDIIILLKIIALNGDEWQYRDLSSSLLISISEISESLKRSNLAGLYDSERRAVKRTTLMEFIQFGLPYVFPVVPGSIVNGIETAHSHPFFKNLIISDQVFVWPHSKGTARGEAIEPLHSKVPEAALTDELLYKLLASVDVLRVGRVRERKLAIEELEKHIL